MSLINFNEDILSEKIGLAGCGSMGLPMLKSLLAKGVNVKGYDIAEKKSLDVVGANIIKSKREFMDNINILISVVRDANDTVELCEGPNGLFKQHSNKILIISSTLSPRFLFSLKSKAPKNIMIVDAPMSGATIAAEQSTLTFMVGCKEKMFEYVYSLLSVMGKQVEHIGQYGSGMMVKVLNNFIAAASVVSVRHVINQAQKFDLDLEKVLKTIDTSSGQTWFGSNREKIGWFKECYGEDNTIGILKKDVEAYVDAFENESDLDNFVSGELSTSIIKAICNMPFTK